MFVLAATNLPWELDMALLRRLEKRVHVPFPTKLARSWMIRRLLPPGRVERCADLDAVAEKTEGYSGSDLTLVCKVPSPPPSPLPDPSTISSPTRSPASVRLTELMQGVAQGVATRSGPFSPADWSAPRPQEAAMRPLRRLLSQLDDETHDLHAPPPQPGPVTAGDVEAVRPRKGTPACVPAESHRIGRGAPHCCARAPFAAARSRG